jgi:3-O-methylgallate 3,4-dioxygenase
MADLVLAMGTSHSPSLNHRPEDYPRNAELDRHGRRLLDKSGHPVTYDQLLAQAAPGMAGQITPGRIAERVDQCNAGQDHLARVLGDARLDALIIVGDDQHEQFHDDNMPAMLVYWGETIPGAAGSAGLRDYPVASKLGHHVIGHLLDNGFDMSHATEVSYRYGEGHALAFVRARLMQDAALPVLPVLLNTYFPPNQPRPGRCYQLGRALRAAVECWHGAGRIGILASGRLNHYAVDEKLDRRVLKACRERDEETLAVLPLRRRHRMRHGDGGVVMRARYRLGVDVGGTHTDLVLNDIQDGTLRIEKLASSPDNPALAVLEGLARLIEDGVDPGEIGFFAHGTTVTTNALLENAGARVGLLINDGFGAICEVQTQARDEGNPFDHLFQRLAPIAPPSLTRGIGGRMDAAGTRMLIEAAAATATPPSGMPTPARGTSPRAMRSWIKELELSD